ncbi:tyrosine-type recombinase/integrase [Isoptericola sp. NPDC056578]|uniref:tyrosine-type recombinase/integrase n=1 Tax=Isoptericola sp. NPDC056578 TaxID=3345870 RepID=UPI0036B1FE15
MTSTLTGKVTWRARYYADDGKQRSRNFPRKVDAQRWLDEQRAALVTGQYADPRAGKMTFGEYADEWRARQVHRPATVDQIDRHFRNHVYVAIGNMPLSKITQGTMQTLVKTMSEKLSPSTVTVIWRYVSSVMKSAVADKKIATTPCVGVKLPAIEKKKVVPIPTATIESLADLVPERYRALVILTAATGMRQGEVFGLTWDRIDLLHRRIKVDRQLRAVDGSAPSFGPVKTPTSNRTIPLPQVAADALAAHQTLVAPGPSGLVFTSTTGAPLRRSSFNETWHRATDAAGVTATFHELRHYYASLLIRHGESVKVVQTRLGHKSAQETLDTYAHLWPDSDDRTREAVDSVLLTRPNQDRALDGVTRLRTSER